MFGNGVMIGMEVIVAVHRQTREELHRARSVCFVAVAGATTPIFAELLIVTTTFRTTATTIWASACSAVQSDIHLCFELRNI